MTLVSFGEVSVEFGQTTVLRDVTWTISEGERWGIVGRNGAGKTTLFNLILGEMAPTSGLVVRNRDLRISVLEQHRDFEGAHTVWEAASAPFAELFALEHSLAEQATAMTEHAERTTDEMLARYDRDLERFGREGGYEAASRVDAVLHGLGFDPERARSQPLTTLSGGERGRLGLVQQLVAPADLLLLDEPTNHLDLDTTKWLEEYLRGLSATVLVVSHDRAFLDGFADHVLHLEAKTTEAYNGGYSSFVVQRAERRLSQQRSFEKQQKVVEKESDYIRRHIAGQNSSQAKGRRRRLTRLPRLSPPPGESGAMAVQFDIKARGGDQAVVLDDVTIAVEDRRLLEHFSGVVRRGDVLGLIGANGTGKSTLVRALMGERTPERGEIRIGGSIEVSYYQQDLGQVPIDQTLFDIIHDLRPSWNRGQVQGHLGRFDFSGDEVQRRPSSLSGGERARVALAMIMLSGANFLIFDEPTNHLDVESIEALEDAIDAFEGTVLLVSHDRALLRALTTRIWVLEERRISDFPGGFTEWEALMAERRRAAVEVAREEAAKERQRGKDRTARGGAQASKLPRPLTAARRVLADTEARVHQGETQVREVKAALEDPQLYGTAEGGRRAATLGAELREAEKALAGAFLAWERALGEVERLQGAAPD